MGKRAIFYSFSWQPNVVFLCWFVGSNPLIVCFLYFDVHVERPAQFQLLLLVFFPPSRFSIFFFFSLSLYSFLPIERLAQLLCLFICQIGKICYFLSVLLFFFLCLFVSSFLSHFRTFYLIHLLLATCVGWQQQHYISLSPPSLLSSFLELLSLYFSRERSP